jgi:hypothetical protein
MEDLIPDQVANVQAFIYEGEIVRDEEGNITNPLVQTVEYTDLPVIEEAN